jgi:hypothetical protein
LKIQGFFWLNRVHHAFGQIECVAAQPGLIEENRHRRAILPAMIAAA